MPRGHALIIEDSSTARIILSRLLERADLTSKGVATAEEAFPLLQNESFDIIFLDHLLPGMNGFQALERLKSQSHTREIPVFMYTSQSAERYTQEAKALGASGVIRKQIDREQLLRTLDAILTGTPEPEYSRALTLAVEKSAQFSTELQSQRARGIFGRMATLEVAYEETDEEITALRQSIAAMQLQHQEELQRHRHWLRMVGTGAFAGILLLGGLFLWQESSIARMTTQVNDQVSLIHRVIGGVIELMDQRP